MFGGYTLFARIEDPAVGATQATLLWGQLLHGDSHAKSGISPHAQHSQKITLSTEPVAELKVRGRAEKDEDSIRKQHILHAPIRSLDFDPKDASSNILHPPNMLIFFYVFLSIVFYSFLSI